MVSHLTLAAISARAVILDAANLWQPTSCASFVTKVGYWEEKNIRIYTESNIGPISVGLWYCTSQTEKGLRKSIN